MNQLTKLFVPFLAVAAMATWSFVSVSRADDAAKAGAAAATGSVSVTVTDSDDKPVEGATVRLTLPKGAATQPSAAATGQANGGADKPKNAPVAMDKTDKDGKVTLKDVPAGDYNVSANMKGSGHARDKVTVEAGKTADVTLKLAQGQPKKAQ